MPGEELSFNLFKLVAPFFGAYLLIHGLLGIFRFRTVRSYLLFSASSVFLSFFFLAPDGHLIGEISVLTTWSFYYLFIRSNQPFKSSSWYNLLVFIIPVGWCIVPLTGPIQYHSFFQSIYFVHFTLLVLMSIHITYSLARSKFINKGSRMQFLLWLHIGLLILIGFRIILPLVLLDLESYMKLFHVLTATYFIGVSAFFVNPREAFFSDSMVFKEETSNYEEELKRRLENALKKEKVFLVPDLSLQELALKMQIKSSELSSFLSATLGKNFNDVINEYRIDEVKRLIADPTTDPKSTIMELAYQSGFNSKATFNRIFKRITGSTPKAYRKANAVIL